MAKPKRNIGEPQGSSLGSFSPEDASQQTIGPWNEDPQQIQDWIALFCLETMESFRMQVFFRWLAQRTRDQELVAECGELLGETQKALRRAVKPHITHAQAVIRQLLHMEDGNTEMADKLNSKIRETKAAIYENYDQVDVIANRMEGDRSE